MTTTNVGMRGDPPTVSITAPVTVEHDHTKVKIQGEPPKLEIKKEK